MRAIILLVLCGSVGCASATPEPKASPEAARAAACRRNLAVGDAMSKRGRHLEASFYYEAALTPETDEVRILPKLIAAQVRSGRLRAAGNNTARLIALVGEQPELVRLSRLLSAYAPPLGGEDALSSTEPVP